MREMRLIWRPVSLGRVVLQSRFTQEDLESHRYSRVNMKTILTGHYTDYAKVSCQPKKAGLGRVNYVPGRLGDVSLSQSRLE